MFAVPQVISYKVRLDFRRAHIIFYPMSKEEIGTGCKKAFLSTEYIITILISQHNKNLN